MLELRNVTKDYLTGSDAVHALRGVSLNFRKSEFVSILGQSGCGKTTLLNIIGGLDRYTSGDLIINGRSTKSYKDRDWDSYRNHSVGFVFQSYNLIPHQTVLQNVELALTLSGVSKSERRRRAKEALEAVGLSSQLKKRPSEMSGGQMQRVAIARAIVNDPDIILADEPTGALDSETSVQVMEILKRISQDRLVVMVTHNPELAETYSTRIVRMFDGKIVSDSSPMTEDEIKEAEGSSKEKALKKAKKEKKPSMSFLTSFGLSLRNLISKKGRTMLTSFAGSIGIIGIALIIAVSQGLTNYINLVQENTLSSYPITLEAQHVSIGTLMETFMGMAQNYEEHENDAVYQRPILYDIVNTLSAIEAKENDLASFKVYLENNLSSEENKRFNDAINGIQYTYNVDFQIYTKNVDGKIIRSDTESLVREMLVKYLSKINGAAMDSGEEANTGMLSMLTSNTSAPMMTLWQELLPAKDGSPINPLIKNQYDLIHGRWPANYDEIVIIVDKNNEIDDMTLYSLGLISEEEIDKIVNAAADAATNSENKAPIEYSVNKWSYEDICNMEFRTILGADCYTDSNKDGIFEDIRESSIGLETLYANGIKLKVTGIIKLNEDATTTMLQGTIGYTHMLTKHIINENAKASSIAAQLNSPNKDIFTGLPFKDTNGNVSDEDKEIAFREYLVSLNENELAEAYVKIKSIPTDEYIAKVVGEVIGKLDSDGMRTYLIQTLSSMSASISEDQIKNYVKEMSDEEVKNLLTMMIAQGAAETYAAEVEKAMADIPAETLASYLNAELPTYTTEQCAKYYESVLEFSTSTYDNNLLQLGYVQLEKPASINIFASSFSDKDIIEEMITKYNENVDEVSRIEYTDYMGIMMASITTIIDAITYVLIAFVSVSLIVSSIMIGVITLISVQERTKEIGILRAIGASKRNVCSMFNAETIMLGLASGIVGVVITYLLCIPINIILYALTGISGLKATLPIGAAFWLVVISFTLTLISGLIPSRGAAKKDPVVALRTE